jgi:hypothetical protein
VKFLSKLLIELALSVLLDPSSIYTTQFRNPKDNRLLIEKLNHSWVNLIKNIDETQFVINMDNGRTQGCHR